MTLTGKIGKLHANILTPVDSRKFDRVLICFPQNEEYFRLATFIFKDLLDDPDQRFRFTLLIPEPFRHLFIFSEKGTLFYEPDKFEKLRSVPPVDAIVDLNPGFYLEMACYISHIRAKYKIGFTSEFSDQFYNIQFDVSKSTILERIYQKIKKMLIQ